MPGAIRVLYVDDEPALLEIGKLFLEETGELAVTTIDSVPTALELLKNEYFDVIISDYQMPVMDGIEFLVAVRNRFGSKPFILFTGRGREEVVIQAINSGADFYLQKGGEPESQFAELSHKIKQAASRKMALFELKKSEEKYRHLIEHSDEAIVVAQDGMLKLVNSRAIKLTGYREQDLLSMSFIEFIHPDDRAMVIERYERRLKGEELPSRYTFRLAPKDGSTLWVEIGVAAIDWEGRPASLNFLTDISERKMAEDALIESEEKFRKAFYTSPDSICITRLNDGVFISVNEGFTKISGYTPEEVLGKSSLEINIWKDPEDRRKIVEELQSKGEVRNYEAHFLTKTGEIYGSMSTLIIELKGVPHILNITHDITEKKHAEEALQESEEKLRHTNKKLALLSSITRHDINNQLMVQIGFLKILEDSNFDASEIEYFHEINTAAMRMSAMIRFTREYEEIGVHAPIWQDCSELVDRSANEVSLGDVKVNNLIPAGVKVFADPLITKVFYNLIDNAVRYGGKITTIKFFVEIFGSNRVIVCEDDGKGVPANEKEQIFKRDFGENTGLGLAFSREVLDITGIIIMETGEAGHGARFEIIVPDGKWSPDEK